MWFSGSMGWRSGESAHLPTMCSGIRFRHLASYVGRVCCWFSPLLRGCFSRFSGFPLSSKINISKFPFDREFKGHRFISQRLLCVTLIKQIWFIYYLLFIIYSMHIIIIENNPSFDDHPCSKLFQKQGHAKFVWKGRYLIYVTKMRADMIWQMRSTSKIANLHPISIFFQWN